MRTIGVMMTNFFGEYTAQIWPGIVRGAAEAGVNLLVFPGYTETWSIGYLFQQSVIYSKITPKTVDALVIISGTYANKLDAEEYQQFFDRFRDIPGVSIGSRVPHKTAILVDNATGLDQMIRHVLSTHERKTPAMISGPLTNEEARERLQVFRDTCASLGVPLGSCQLYEGDFTISSGHEAVRTLFSEKNRSDHPDVLICANDNMAFGAIRELQKLGYRVPFDVAVTGFDNLKESRFSFPSLSTINQPLEQQGYQALMTAVDLSKGRCVPEEIVLPTNMVVRSSCGCHSASEERYLHSLSLIEKESFDDSVEHKLYESFWNCTRDNLPEEAQNRRSQQVIRAVFEAAVTGTNHKKALSALEEHLHILVAQGQTIHPWVSHINLISAFLQKNAPTTTSMYDVAIFLGSCTQVVVSLLQVEQGITEFRLSDQINTIRTYLADIGTALTIDDISTATRSHLAALGVKSFYIAMFDKPIVHCKGEPWTDPASSQLIIGYHDGEDIPLQERGMRILRGQLVPHLDAAGTPPRSMIVCPLYFRDEIIGFMMIDQTDVTREIYDIIAAHVSILLKSAALFEAREASEKKLLEVLRELEKSNTQLQKISEIDELTGLYNRRGFLNLARRSISLAQQMGRGGLMFFADLDGLKKINDQYGHTDGDLAIKIAGAILHKTFRNMDVVSRLGGDEFTILALDTDADFIPIIKSRIQEQLDEENKKLGKPWKVSISIGATAFNTGDDLSLEKLMTRADANLYVEKKQKKK